MPRHIFIVSSLLSASVLSVPLWSCGSGRPLAEVCEDLTDRADRERQAARGQADRACIDDEDCTLASARLECMDGCGVTDAVAKGDPLQANVRKIETELCGEFREHGCRYAGKCGPPESVPIVVCRTGRCEVELQPLE